MNYPVARTGDTLPKGPRVARCCLRCSPGGRVAAALALAALAVVSRAATPAATAGTLRVALRHPFKAAAAVARRSVDQDEG